MHPSSRLPFRVMLLALLVMAGLAACTAPDPRAQLTAARAAYEIAVVGNWAQTPPTEESPIPAAVLTIRVTRRETTVALPCLTVDVLFYGVGEGDPVEVGRRTVELDLADIEQLGGTKEILRRLPLPEGAEVDQLGVVLHDPGDEEGLRALCEARAFPDMVR